MTKLSQHDPKDPKWPEMTKNDPKWPKMAQNDRKGSKMTKITKMTWNDPKWSKMTKNHQNVPKWPTMTKMTQNDPKWSKMTKNDQNVPKWPQNGSIGVLRRFQIWLLSHHSREVQSIHLVKKAKRALGRLWLSEGATLWIRNIRAGCGFRAELGRVSQRPKRLKVTKLVLKSTTPMA